MLHLPPLYFQRYDEGGLQQKQIDLNCVGVLYDDAAYYVHNVLCNVRFKREYLRNASKTENCYLLNPLRDCPFHVNFSFGSLAS